MKKKTNKITKAKKQTYYYMGWWDVGCSFDLLLSGVVVKPKQKHSYFFVWDKKTKTNLEEPYGRLAWYKDVN